MTCHMTTSFDALIEQAGGCCRVAEMDRAELVTAMETLHPASFAWALACCRRNRDDAEEVLQTVYVMVLEGRARFEGRSLFKTWLFGVIRRASLSYRRMRWLREARLSRWFREAEKPSAVDASSSLESSECAAQLVAALNVLAPRQREMLELVFYHDMTVEEAASVMRIGIGSARTHYDRGKKRLRAILRREVQL